MPHIDPPDRQYTRVRHTCYPNISPLRKLRYHQALFPFLPQHKFPKRGWLRLVSGFPLQARKSQKIGRRNITKKASHIVFIFFVGSEMTRRRPRFPIELIEVQQNHVSCPKMDFEAHFRQNMVLPLIAHINLLTTTIPQERAFTLVFRHKSMGDRNCIVFLSSEPLPDHVRGGLWETCLTWRGGFQVDPEFVVTKASLSLLANDCRHARTEYIPGAQPRLRL